jgi:putative lipoprotein (rSAM/lipoprotein system)
MKINKVFIKGINLALAGVLSLLGFVGCENNHGLYEYGSPYTDYTVKGVVVNKATKKPIEGIWVGYSPEPTAITMYGVQPTQYIPKAHVLTNNKGEFKLTDRSFSMEFQLEDGKKIVPLYVEDIDGEKNGLFQSEQIMVDFSEVKLSGKPKSWYQGEYAVSLNVELTESKTDR